MKENLFLYKVNFILGNWFPYSDLKTYSYFCRASILNKISYQKFQSFLASFNKIKNTYGIERKIQRFKTIYMGDENFIFKP